MNKKNSKETTNTSMELTILNVQDPSSFASITVGAQIEITGKSHKHTYIHRKLKTNIIYQQ